MVDIRDWRDRQAPAGPDPKCGALLQGRLLLRDPKHVTGITLHQMDAYLSPGHLADRHERALKVHAHASCFQDGVGVIAYPLLSYIYHGNGANATRLGLEMEGSYPGKQSKGTELCSLELIECGRAMIQRLIEEAAKEGCTIVEIDAHRQWSASRRADPGEELWRKLVVEWAVPKLGLRCNYAFHSTGLLAGKSIPRQWDPKGVGDY